MNLDTLIHHIMDIPFNEFRTVYTTDSTNTLFVYRPEMPSLHLRNEYDRKKNFQIFIGTEEDRAKPAYEELVRDLHYKRISYSLNFQILFKSIEDIYSGGDPDSHFQNLSALSGDKIYYSYFTCLCLVQLMMAEQEINTQDHWKVKPSRAFLMGKIREVNAQESDIETIIRNLNYRSPRKFLTPPRYNISPNNE